ncbi:hypothetical protein GF360_04290 [candidate division WWE3 bacterium]|nr:hypothetical protein [candidate division WWE3 bacterium]
MKRAGKKLRNKSFFVIVLGTLTVSVVYIMYVSPVERDERKEFQMAGKQDAKARRRCREHLESGGTCETCSLICGLGEKKRREREEEAKK